MTRNNMKYFSVITPDVLLKIQEDKSRALRGKLPELMAMADKMGGKPKVQFFE
jgi:hypothetical protein